MSETKLDVVFFTNSKKIIDEWFGTDEKESFGDFKALQQASQLMQTSGSSRVGLGHDPNASTETVGQAASSAGQERLLAKRLALDKRRANEQNAVEHDSESDDSGSDEELSRSRLTKKEPPSQQGGLNRHLNDILKTARDEEERRAKKNAKRKRQKKRQRLAQKVV